MLEILDIFLLVVHILFCVLLVIAVLLQSGKGGGLAAGLGGGTASSATQVFGGRGAGNFLSRGTVIIASLFMITSLSLAYRSSAPRSAMDLSQQPEGKVGIGAEQIVEEGSVPTAEELSGDTKTINIGTAPGEDGPAVQMIQPPTPQAEGNKEAPAAEAKEAPAAEAKEAPAAE